MFKKNRTILNVALDRHGALQAVIDPSLLHYPEIDILVGKIKRDMVRPGRSFDSLDKMIGATKGPDDPKLSLDNPRTIHLNVKGDEDARQRGRRKTRGSDQ